MLSCVRCILGNLLRLQKFYFGHFFFMLSNIRFTCYKFSSIDFFFIVHVLVAPSLHIQDENGIRIFMPKNKVTNTISAKPTVNKTVNKTPIVFISTKMVANGQTFFENC